MEFSEPTRFAVGTPESVASAEPESTTDPQTDAASATHATASWVVSLCFWMTLVLAAMIYSAVALSPKLAEWLSAREQFTENARQLVRLENDIEYLERVRSALESDPQFAMRLAQASLPNPHLNGEIVPVASELLYGGLTETAPPPIVTPEAERPAATQLIFHLASHQSHRQLLLTAAVLLTVLGFTFLNDSESGSLRTIGRMVLWISKQPLQRYAKPAARPVMASEAEAETQREES